MWPPALDSLLFLLSHEHMDVRLEAPAAIFRLNTGLLARCLDGVTDEEIWRVRQPPANPFGFVVAHMIDARRALAGALGEPVEDQVAGAIGDARGLAEVSGRYAGADLVGAWAAVTGALQIGLDRAGEGLLASPPPYRVPGVEPTLLGLVVFLAQHDSYHLGQLALMRREMGLPAVAYE